MPHILTLGSVAEDRVVSLRSALREGGHLEGRDRGRRIGGGAANTGGALALAGHRVGLISAVGEDDTGGWLMGELAALGLELPLLRVVTGHSTRSLVLRDGAGERTIVNLSRCRVEPPVELVDVEADCLYVRSRARDLAALLATMTATCLVVAHLPPWDEGARPAHVLVTSRSDLRDPSKVDFARGLQIGGPQLRWLVLTRGADGATAFGRDETIDVSSPRIEAVDTTGAGDAFAAGLIHALLAQEPMSEALRVACAWGAAAAESDSSVLPAEAIARLCAGAKP